MLSISAKYELVFLNFYADWCRFSQILAPVFEESAAKVLQEFPVIIAIQMIFVLMHQISGTGKSALR